VHLEKLSLLLYTLFMYNLYLYIQCGVKAMQTISATDLARNTREILDRVASQGETVTIERNHSVIAQIVPPVRTMTALQALAGLALPMLTTAQAAAWLEDSKEDFGDVVRDPWA
jgi:antitoxin (DNA-binding transcriptional repressor) of toxin-antitoxin stability system